MSTGASELWFGSGGHRVGNDKRPVLFCLPHAGGAASAFRGWAEALADEVEVLPVRLPGRERRAGEAAVLDPPVIAAVVAAELRARHWPRYGFYGHSLGGWVAFEVIRELRRLGVPLPVRLYVGGSRPPDLKPHPDLQGLSTEPDIEIEERLLRLGGVSPEVFAHPELRDLVLPVIRADFAWLDNYRYQPESPLPVPVVSFAGSDDPVATAAEVAGWVRHTSAGMTAHTITGGHFFVQDERDQVTDVIRADLPAATAQAQAAPAVAQAPDHCVPLGDTGWGVWQEAVLRMAGFPADGLATFSCPEAAAAADAILDGEDGEAFEKVLAAHWQLCIERAAEIAGQPRFIEAVTWQNPSVLVSLEALRRPSTSLRKSRARAVAVAKYWQRYCGKNDTIGFFGPSVWVRMEPDAAPVVLTHAAEPLRNRRVYLEHWALEAVAGQFVADPEIRRWLPVALAPQLTLDGDQVLRPGQPPMPLRPVEAAAVRSCDGRQANRVVADLVPAIVRTAADGFLLLDRLAQREIVIWGASVPQRPDAEVVLAGQIAAIGDDAASARAAACLGRLTAARDRVAASAGDPDALRTALAELDSEFTDITAASAERRAGQTYAGRRLCYEDTVAGVDVVFGGAVLDALARPLSVLLPAARWLTAALADVYNAALRDLFVEVADDTGQARLSELYYLAQGLLFGSGERPVDQVAAEFVARWGRLFRLDEVAADTARLSFASADLVGPAARTFPADRPGFAAARLHSPDVHICAVDAAALERGDFFAVLGEMHAAWATFDCGVFTTAHPEPVRLRDALAADLGGHRIKPLFPVDWPHYTGRTGYTLDHPTDRQLAFTAAPGADRDRLLPVTAVTVSEQNGRLVARAPDGRTWPPIEVFADLIAVHAVDAFKLANAGAHTPRITVDRLVVVRESWRTTVAETGMADVAGEPGTYLAGRALHRKLGLPERVFVKVSTETKPVFIDLTSPVYLNLLRSLLRRARELGGTEVPVTFTELLPGPEHAWVTDASGRRYCSELRLQLRDPQSGGPS